MINRVVLVGRLVRDPFELRRSQNGTAFSSFTVAVDNRFAKQEDRSADFLPCVVFGKTAEFVSQYARKGAMVGVEGRLQSRTYEKEGRKVYVVEVVCDNVQLLESKSANAQRTSEPSSTSSNRNEYFSQVEPESPRRTPSIDIDDDDLPF